MVANSNIEITDNAVKKIITLLKDEEEGTKFRIQVDGGGCNGFQYNMEFDKNVGEEDNIIKKDGVELLIDNTSMDFLGGSVVDYVISLGAEHFEIRNPNASSSCGCGNSFSV